MWSRSRSPASRPSRSSSTATPPSTSSRPSPPRRPEKVRGSWCSPRRSSPPIRPPRGRRRFAGWADPRAKAAFALFARESVAVPGPAADRLGEIAREHGVWLVTGVNEIDPARPGTLYNTLLYHDPDGRLALRHRKLVPTNHERLVWGQGDGGGLRAIETDFGRLGGLICWENYMPLARFSLYESGVEVYVASTADDGDAWQATLVHIARESRAFVVAPSHFQRASAYPDDFPLRPSSTARTSSAAAAARSSRPTAATSPGRSTTRRASSTPSSTRPVSSRSASASTRQGTTTGRTCCASTYAARTECLHSRRGGRVRLHDADPEAPDRLPRGGLLVGDSRRAATARGRRCRVEPETGPRRWQPRPGPRPRRGGPHGSAARSPQVRRARLGA